jgi:hypothetical protein
MKASGIIKLTFAFLFLLLNQFAQAQCVCNDPGAQTVTWNGWSFQFIRPCLTGPTTSGGNGGGIEIRNAMYNGKLVFSKAHTPILNVKYKDDACGPYRDWQDQESVFDCTNVTASGRCDGPAKTNCDTPDGEDTGSFCGVSVDDQGSKLTLTTDVQAGWYRYILKWNFYPDGSFHPEGWFGAIPSGCVQNPHVHMIYFRIDMDIEGDTPNVVEERNTSNFKKPAKDSKNPPEFIWQVWDPVIVEMTRMKQHDNTRWWRIRNTNTNRAYLIYPPEVYPGQKGEDEVNIFGQLSDIWFLKYNSANQEETNDGGSFNRYWAHLGQFINDSTWPGDNLQGADAVVWYSGGTLHDTEGSDAVCHDVQGPWFVPDPEGPSW